MNFKIKIDTCAGWSTVFSRDCDVGIVNRALDSIKASMQYAAAPISYMVECDDDPRFDKSGVIDLQPEFLGYLPHDYAFPDIVRLSGKTLSWFSLRFDIPYRTVQDWNAGRRNPPKYVLKLLADALNLPSA